MQNYSWYAKLKKPRWAPPAWLFGPVWTVLYILIGISFGGVAVLASRGAVPLIVTLPFVLNLIFNLSFTPLQFGLKNNLLAAVDVLLVWGTLVWAIAWIFPLVTWIAYMQIPYILWVSFATVLQLTVTWMNRRA